MPQLKLSQSSVKRLAGESSPTKTTIYRDTELRGLALKITPTGSISFIVDKRIKGGSPKRVKLGNYPTLSVKEAKELATDKLKLLQQGINPVEKDKDDTKQKEEAKAIEEARSITLRGMLKGLIESRDLKENTAYGYTNVIRSCTSDWLMVPVKDITRRMIEDRFNKIRQGKIKGTGHLKGKQVGTPSMANLWSRVITAVFNYAKAEEVSEGVMVIDRNPAEVLKDKRIKRTNRPRTNYIHEDDLYKFFAAAATYPNQSLGRWLVLCLLAGLRKSEALNLRWEDVNFDRGYFVIREPKNGLDHYVPMNTAIGALLHAQHSNCAITSEDEDEPVYSNWVFPSTRLKDKPIQEPRKAYEYVSRITGIEFSPHDLRRTFASMCNKVGLEHTTIKRALNHKQKDITEIYIQTDLEFMKTRMEDVYLAFAKAMLGVDSIDRKRLDQLTELAIGSELEYDDPVLQKLYETKKGFIECSKSTRSN